MNHSAKIQDVDALRELFAALAKFGVQARSALDTANAELRRANEVLKRAASFFGAELDRHYRK